jgi:hypothetical protein
MDALDLDWGGLTGEDPDAVIGKAVTALPLLASDKGMAKPIAAAPETGAAPADAQLTDDPGSDWWRGSGGAVLWGVGLILAGGLFAWWVLRTNRARRRTRPEALPVYVPDTVPENFYELPQDPDLAPAEKPASQPTTGEPATEEPAAEEPPTTQPVTAESAAEEPAATSLNPAEPAEDAESTDSPPSPLESTKDTSTSGESGDAKPATPSDQKDKE